MSLNFKEGRMYKCSGGAIWRMYSFPVYQEVNMQLVRRGRDPQTVIGGDATREGGIRSFNQRTGVHVSDADYKILHEVVP